MRGYYAQIIALGGSHKWFREEIQVTYLHPPHKIRILMNIYSLYRRLITKRHIESDFFLLDRFLAKRFKGLHIDLIRLLADNLKDADAHIATYYPTALAMYLSSAKGDRYYLVQDFNELVREVDGTYGEKLYELTLKLPCTYLAISNFIKELIRRTNNQARVYVVGAGVDPQVFRLYSRKLVECKNRRIVMIMLRGLRYKGDDDAIATINKINKKIPIHDIIVGNKDIRKLLSKYRIEVPYTVYTNVDDHTLAQLYSSADVFLFTSYIEGFGLPPLEAMACGTPVVTTDCGGNRDYAKHLQNCILVKPGDIEALVKAVIAVLTDDKLRENLIEGGLQTAKLWSWDKIVERFEKAIEGDIVE